MSRHAVAARAGTASELLLLVSLLTLWLGVTLLLGPLSLFVWAGAVAMAAILRPPHERQRTPESVTDVLAVAVAWCAVCGIAGAVADLVAPPRFAAGDFSWTFLAELSGFCLGFVWVLVLLLIRHIEQTLGRYGRV